MKKFFVLYHVPVETMTEWRKNTSAKEIKAQGVKLGAAMMSWTKKNEKALVDKGLPLGKNIRMNATGTKEVSNDLNYYCVVEAESADAVVGMFKDNPHFDIPTSFIDIMEIPHLGL